MFLYEAIAADQKGLTKGPGSIRIYAANINHQGSNSPSKQPSGWCLSQDNSRRGKRLVVIGTWDRIA